MRARDTRIGVTGAYQRGVFKLSLLVRFRDIVVDRYLPHNLAAPPPELLLRGHVHRRHLPGPVHLCAPAPSNLSGHPLPLDTGDDRGSRDPLLDHPGSEPAVHAPLQDTAHEMEHCLGLVKLCVIAGEVIFLIKESATAPRVSGIALLVLQLGALIYAGYAAAVLLALRYTRGILAIGDCEGLVYPKIAERVPDPFWHLYHILLLCVNTVQAVEILAGVDRSPQFIFLVLLNSIPVVLLTGCALEAVEKWRARRNMYSRLSTRS
uniref:ORF50 n=1 Tax=Latid herpesvirus 1 TaxID=3096545 RepID=A0AB33V6M5_9VIRU